MDTTASASVWLDTKEAARYLHVTKNAIDAMCSRRQVAFYKPGPGKRIFRVEDLDAFLTRNRMATDAELSAKADVVVLALGRGQK